ncbi:MAG: SDR family NAD(P)-dependent oxidoreductase, partial [Pseudomonadota bacterium]
MQFSSIKAIVTGGVSGLGLAVARRFAQRGAALALFDVNEQNAQTAVAEVNAAGAAQARFYPVDVSDEAAVAAAVLQAADDLGGLNVAVNCAGILGTGRVLGKHGAMPLDRFKSTVMINLVGSFNVAKAAAERMQHNEPNTDGERGV